jgi:hypothetical protein
MLQASATYGPPNLAAGEGVITSVTVSGAVLGGFARASLLVALQGIALTAWVKAAGAGSRLRRRRWSA